MHEAAGAPPAAAAGPSGPAQPVAGPWQRFGWVMAVVWMFFLIYPIIGLITSAASLPLLVPGWAALAVFAVIYVWGFVRGMSGRVGGLTEPAHRSQWIIFAMLIVCAALTVPAADGQALSFLPFIISFASYGLNRPAHWISFAVAVAIAWTCVLVLDDGRDYIIVASIVLVLGVVNTVSTELIIRSERFDRMSLDLATSRGRENVARDVHDLIGHALTVVRLKAQLAHRLVDADPARAKAELAEIEALTAEAIAGVRTTVAGARVTSFAEQLAASAMAMRDAGIAVRVVGEAEALSPAQSLVAGWILREATTNVLRHAEATRVTVRIAPGSMRVIDNGRGARQADSPGSTELPITGNGIAGMRERAAAAGAALHVGSASGRGTEVSLTW